jgi:L-cysteine S-thiosulfotransferase
MGLLELMTAVFALFLIRPKSVYRFSPTGKAYSNCRPPGGARERRIIAGMAPGNVTRSSSRAGGRTAPASATGIRLDDLVHAALAASALLLGLGPAGAAEIDTPGVAASRESPTLQIVADGIPQPIGGVKGSADRGHALVLAHDAANCILCHALSDPGVQFSGNLGPPLDGIANKFSAAQLRLRVADNLRLNPATIMPSYYRVEGLDRVASAFRGRPILEPQQIEDVVAYLATLK